jgi:hypothetical protein
MISGRRSKQIEELIDILCRKSEEQYQIFVDILRETDNKDALKVLQKPNPAEEVLKNVNEKRFDQPLG